MLEIYLGAGDGGEEDTAERAARVFGDVLAEGQVHLPVRLFARDMLAARFPLVRYEIRWTPEQLRPLGTRLYCPLGVGAQFADGSAAQGT